VDQILAEKKAEGEDGWHLLVTLSAAKVWLDGRRDASRSLPWAQHDRAAYLPAALSQPDYS